MHIALAVVADLHAIKISITFSHKCHEVLSILGGVSHKVLYQAMAILLGTGSPMTDLSFMLLPMTFTGLKLLLCSLQANCSNS